MTVSNTLQGRTQHFPGHREAPAIYYRINLLLLGSVEWEKSGRCEVCGMCPVFRRVSVSAAAEGSLAISAGTQSPALAAAGTALGRPAGKEPSGRGRGLGRDAIYSIMSLVATAAFPLGCRFGH